MNQLSRAVRDYEKIINTILTNISNRFDTIVPAGSIEDVGTWFQDRLESAMETYAMRSVTDRAYSQKGIRASSLSKLCVRKWAWQRKEDTWQDIEPSTPARRRNQTDLSRKAIIGTAIHEFVQTNLLPNLTGVKVLVQLRCRSCNNVGLGYAPSDNSRSLCSVCGGLNQSEEIDLHISSKIAETYDIHGHADAVIEINDKWAVLEMKTLDPDMFQGLQRKMSGDKVVLEPSTFLTLPRARDLPQAKIYPHLVAKSIPHFDLSKCLGTLLVYIDRASLSFKKPIVISVDKDIMKWLSGMAAAIRRYELGDPMEAEPACTSRSSSLAQTCYFVDRCFPKKRDGKKTQAD